ncbi:uncharacterized protein E0L32_010933 [Thyridium curvatum]|uniref:NTF2 domain-containing protein n=1 Tax=Thyridium curvatum TaxID=1093900 RepID=A0A507AF31_9PEZI|nr:uncharacterized protein E0L32_010933 [Thyridium curvatum]TPX07132.1 hypothetical protein E0L32_010933 [Thyridium curvatum]
MAGPVSEEAQVKITSEAAQTFIDWYYSALNDKKPLASFYVDSNTKYASAGVKSDISANGLHLAGGPAELEALLNKHAGQGQGTASRSERARYEVEGFDAQVVNPDFRVACPAHLLAGATAATSSENNSGGGGGGPAPRGRGAAVQAAAAASRVSIAVQVTGWVQYGASKESPRSTFNEVFVLVPNWDAVGPKAARGLKHWLIMSQNFRAL